MRRNGEALMDARITKKILRSLDSRFNYVIDAIEEYKEVDKLTMNEFMGSLQAYEQKILKRNGDKKISIPYNQNYPSNKTDTNKKGLQ
jgi:uridine kinase